MKFMKCYIAIQSYSKKHLMPWENNDLNEKVKLYIATYKPGL